MERQFIKATDIEEIKEFCEKTINRTLSIPELIIEITKIIYDWSDRNHKEIITIFAFPVSTKMNDFMIVYKEDDFKNKMAEIWLECVKDYEKSNI